MPAMLQAMVPFWDALNHITGRSNIRLNHHERRCAAQKVRAQASKEARTQFIALGLHAV